MRIGPKCGTRVFSLFLYLSSSLSKFLPSLLSSHLLFLLSLRSPPPFFLLFFINLFYPPSLSLSLSLSLSSLLYISSSSTLFQKEIPKTPKSNKDYIQYFNKS
ncbi:hypothetical protein LguiA_033950 [Lonicera macranthoides]